MASALLPFLFILTNVLAPTPATRPQQVALDQEFDIKVGEQVSIANERLRISFSRVAEDSRCPEGVQCVWAGNARILLKLTKARRRSASAHLNTGVEPKLASYRGYEVKLVKLEPYPKEGGRIRRRQYTATLVVSRR